MGNPPLFRFKKRRGTKLQLSKRATKGDDLPIYEPGLPEVVKACQPIPLLRYVEFQWMSNDINA